jgi:hypothetical protein
VNRARAAALVLTPLVLVSALSGCRDDRNAKPPLTGNGPGASVEQQLDDMESTLDSVESELNDG